jgi:hypothetical protein
MGGRGRSLHLAPWRWGNVSLVSFDRIEKIPFMKYTIALSLFAVFGLASALAGDKNHETIEKVMKKGLKGDESPAAKVIDGAATDEEINSLAALIGTMKGTEAPEGDQADYTKKVDTLIAAIDVIAGGDHDSKAVGAFKKASNCKSCHNDHKPKKD